MVERLYELLSKIILWVLAIFKNFSYANELKMRTQKWYASFTLMVKVENKVLKPQR